MVTILTPRLDPLIEVPGDQVAAYCQEHDLACTRTNTGDWVAYPANLQQTIDSISDRSPIIIREVKPSQSL